MLCLPKISSHSKHITKKKQASSQEADSIHWLNLWRTIEINYNTFHVVKPCDRCAITTVDEERGVMTGKEPLAPLAKYRKVLFGQCLLSTEKGVLHVGDKVQVIE